MKKAKVTWIALGLVAVLLVAGMGLVHYASARRPARPPPQPTTVYQLTEQMTINGPVPGPVQLSLLQRFQNYLRIHFPPLIDMRIAVSGPTGTPVVVGYRLDDSARQTVLRALAPTNWTVRARRKVEAAVKNVASTNVYLGFAVSSARQPYSGWSVPEESPCPPFYGLKRGYHWGPGYLRVHSGGTLMPTDWPVTLPPGHDRLVVPHSASLVTPVFSFEAYRNPKPFQDLLDEVGNPVRRSLRVPRRARKIAGNVRPEAKPGFSLAERCRG